MDAGHYTSLFIGIGLLACAVRLGRLSARAGDSFLGGLALACVLLAITQFASAVPGWLRGEVWWIYLPRLAGFLVVLRQIVWLKLAR